MVGDSQEVKEDWHMVLPREEDYIGRNKAYRGSSDFFLEIAGVPVLHMFM